MLVEDEVTQRMITSRLLERKMSMRVMEAANGKEALFYIDKDDANEIDVVLLDLQMSEMDGFQTLAKIKETRPDLPVIMLTGSDDMQDAIKSIKAGAVDFITKPAEPERLNLSIENALKISTLSQEVFLLKRKETNLLTFEDIIGYDRGLAEVIQKARKAASSDIPVLVSGETGVGKEIFSRAIHSESKRFGAPFIAVNCAAIPENLVESTLFGHEKGAFTGAIAKSLGKFREADGGTLFLDEIGELPLEAQAKLLRVLQQKEIEPVGAGKSVKVNVRIISATNRNLADEVRGGNFREDLLYRLNVLPIEIPALRKRKQDILPLAYYYLKKFCATEKKQLKKLSSAAENILLEHNWTGNVRELENSMFRAVVLSEKATLEGDDIQSALSFAAQTQAVDGNLDLTISLKTPDGRIKKLEDIEKELLSEIINYHNGSIPKAAEALGVAKSTLYRRLENS